MTRETVGRVFLALGLMSCVGLFGVAFLVTAGGYETLTVILTVVMVVSIVGVSLSWRRRSRS